MSVIAYKAFERGLVATRGHGRYQFKEGLNVTGSAKCASSGFHCAEDPLDMFNYYSPGKNTEYRLVIASGDIDEDGNDSKIACTRLIIKQELSIEQVAAAALLYWEKHPERSREEYIKAGYFRLACGKSPIQKGKEREWLGFALGTKNHIERIAMLYIDGVHYLPETFYNIDGQEVKANEK